MMTPKPSQPALRLRSVFISDVHLGFKGCRAGFLLDFLRRVECEQLYLVGDIIDLWSLERTFYWPQQHNDVIRTLLGKAKHGTRVVYVPGNHDRVFRDYDGWVFGNGPALADCRRRFPDAVYVGYKFGAELAAHIAACDVFVFPSRTDTFGLVLLEAMACGVPVAAYPVTGPVDVVDDGVTGVLGHDLRVAALTALDLDPRACREHALRYTWEAATRQFLGNLVTARGGARRWAEAASGA